MPAIEEKVDRLERVLAEFITSVRESHLRTEAELREFKDEMRAFKDEMIVFKDGMTTFKDEMIVFKDGMTVFQDEMRVSKGEMIMFKDGMTTFKDEMREFKDEMTAFKDEARQINRDMNIKWGEMAKKLGTITEDLVAPSMPRIAKEEFDLEVTDLMVRRKKRLKDGRVKEYDAIVVAGEYVFVNETKSTLKSEDVKNFVDDIKIFREFFPEYKESKIIGVLASLYVDESVIRYAEDTGFMVLSVGDQLMEVKNTKGFKPKEW